MADIIVFDKIKDNLRALEFMLTTNCNLSCEYCYIKNIDKGDFNKKLLLDVFEAYDNNKLDQVIFFGGEPLLKSKLIIDMIPVITRKYPILIVTNGTMINKDFVESIISYESKIHIQISLDGPKYIHNRTRSNSYDKVIDGIKTLIRYKYRNWSIHTTVNKFALPYLYKIYKHNLYLSKFSANKFRLFDMQIIHDCNWDDNDIAIAKVQIQKIIDEYPTTLVDISNKADQMTLCSAGKTYYSFFANGDITPCHRAFDHIIANYKTGLFNDNLFDVFRHYTDSIFYGDNKKCINCKYKKWCYFCPLANYENVGDLFVQPIQYCQLKQNIGMLFYDNINKIKQEV